MDSSDTSQLDGLLNFATQRYNYFLEQKEKDDRFDVSFKFNDGQILHADSFTLRAQSEIFKTMLSKQWKKSDDPIPVSEHNYADFMNFLKFLYLCTCDITADNVMALVDLATFYQVSLLKDRCDEFLAKKATNSENLLSIYKDLKKYSLTKALKTAANCIISDSDIFMDIPRDIVMDIVQCDNLNVTEDMLFEIIVKWAQHQCGGEDKATPEAMKMQLNDILPFIHFDNMTVKFLHSVVVPLGYLFSYEKLAEILKRASSNIKDKSPHFRGRFRLTFKDSNGKEAFVMLPQKDLYDYLTEIAPHSYLIYERIPNQGYGTSRAAYGNWDIILPEVETMCDITSLNNNDFVVYRRGNANLAVIEWEFVRYDCGDKVIDKLPNSLDVTQNISFTVGF